MTQDEVGEKVDVTGKYISHIERGQANFSLDVLFGVAAALGVEPYELFLSPKVRQADVLRKAIGPLLRAADPESLQMVLALLERR